MSDPQKGFARTEAKCCPGKCSDATPQEPEARRMPSRATQPGPGWWMLAGRVAPGGSVSPAGPGGDRSTYFLGAPRLSAVSEPTAQRKSAGGDGAASRVRFGDQTLSLGNHAQAALREYTKSLQQ